VEFSGQTGSTLPPQTVPGLSSIGAAVAVIRSWNVQFPAVHNVQGIKIGTWGAVQVSGTQVSLQNLSAQMWDNSGHWQDDTQSNCDVLVFAIPAP